MADQVQPGEEKNGAGESGPAAPRVFVSYTHETPGHKQWVAALAMDLRRNGVDVILDQWEVQLGSDVTLFMESGIRQADRALLVCTPAYAHKANTGEGGVGYERLVVTAELAQRIDTTKFVCVLRAGSLAEAIPTFAQTRRFVDFRDDSKYELALEELLRDVHQVPADPKPPLGSNPFKAADGKVAIDVRRGDARPEDVQASADLEELYARASRLLRQRDLFGWRQLLRETRRAVVEALHTWRRQVQGTRPEAETWPAQRLAAVRAYEPLFLLALCGVESAIPELADQRGLLDDCLEVPSWEESGLTVVVAMPQVLGCVYHHLLGASLIASGRHGAVLQLVTTSVRSEREGLKELWDVRPLWWGFRESGHSCEQQWRFVAELYRSEPWLAHFFVREGEYGESLRAYGMFASLVELAHLLAAGGGPELQKPKAEFMLSIPPLFVLGTERELPAALRRAVPSREVVQLVAEASGITSRQLEESWPAWFRQWVRWHGRDAFFRIPWLRDEPPKLP